MTACGRRTPNCEHILLWLLLLAILDVRSCAELHLHVALAAIGVDDRERHRIARIRVQLKERDHLVRRRCRRPVDRGQDRLPAHPRRG